jgi:AcrR family transcriptional regulator
LERQAPNEQNWSMKLSSQDDRPAIGLRERKKAKTHAAIQREALRLFREQGYAATTVEQIAEAAEVSPSTFFRYFPTKEDVALWDEFDPMMVEAFRAQPADLTPIQALRRAFRAIFDELSAEELAEQRERFQLILSTPELRAATLGQFIGTVEMLSEVVAERVARRADELAVRTLAGAVIGVVMSAALAAAEDPAADYITLIDAGMAHLEAGLPL